MTKSKAAQVSARGPGFLQYKFASVLSRRCGQNLLQFKSHSTSPIARHCPKSTYLLRSHVGISHYCSSPPLPLSSRKRTISTLGLCKFKSPSKQTRPQTSEHRERDKKFHISSEFLARQNLQSSLGSWAIAAVAFVVIVISSATLGQTTVVNDEKRKPHEVIEETQEEISNMTGEALLGRPGTLTPEQDEKLKEFWIATLQVFGVLDAKDLAGNGTETPNGKPRSDTATSKKPKKKRLSMFRSKNKEDGIDSVETSSDADDKYGQTKGFHDALANMSPETLRNTFWSMVKHDHPDALLLRFLRARKWNVEDALIMMVSTMRWRAEDVNVDGDIMANGELAALEDENGCDATKKKQGSDFLAQMRLGKSFLHGLDKSGRPMCFVRARLHKQGEQSEESLERYTIFIIESARMVLSPPVDTACVVFDLTGFSMANMDYAPVKFMIKCFEANYPESLGVVLVHKAPWVFQGIWKIIKGWLDPVVASKVHFTNNNEEMEEFVPRSQIIKQLGGDEDWTYEYVEPVPGENDMMKDTATRDKLLSERQAFYQEYEKSTLDWIHGNGDVSTVKLKRNEVANTLKEDYWRVDPYIRAKSLYDRTGMINSGGNLKFYPTKEAAPATTNGAVKPVETSPDDLD